MNKYLTLKQLAEIVGVNNYYMKNYIASHYCSFIEKKMVKYHYMLRTKNGLKEHENRRPMLVIDRSNLTDFKEWWNHRPVGRRNSNTLTEGGKNYKWTETALDCYNANKICANCRNFFICKDLPEPKPMKEYVKKTFELIGKPPERIYSYD